VLTGRVGDFKSDRGRKANRCSKLFSEGPITCLGLELYPVDFQKHLEFLEFRGSSAVLIDVPAYQKCHQDFCYGSFSMIAKENSPNCGRTKIPAYEEFGNNPHHAVIIMNE